MGLSGFYGNDNNNDHGTVPGMTEDYIVCGPVLRRLGDAWASKASCQCPILVSNNNVNVHFYIEYVIRNQFAPLVVHQQYNVLQ